ncbi:hypothetical protein AV521_30690 [Streptomyces sp. IMTB 2501]|nr:hypothetical protein AV521_30690 [Streptomyces sp. IMTB 2501]
MREPEGRLACGILACYQLAVLQIFGDAHRESHARRGLAVIAVPSREGPEQRRLRKGFDTW